MVFVVPVVMFFAYRVGDHLGGPFWGVGAALSGLVVFVCVLLVAGRV